MNLDEPAHYGEIDRSDALADVESAHEQWAQAPRMERCDLGEVTAVVVTGMGGSGIAGAVVRQLAADRLPVPVIPHAGYGLPAFVGPRTLVLAASYSGGTEETLSAVETALARGARVVGVSSGGALAELGREHGFPVATVPGGRMPRHSLGYLAVPLLSALGLDDDVDEAVAIQRELAGSLGRNISTAENPAKGMARRVAEGGVTVVWGTQGVASVAAYRLKCQLNENAKAVAHSAELPELDHNEVVGWQEPAAGVGVGALVVLRDPTGDHERVHARIQPSVALVRDRFTAVCELRSVGVSATARLASLVLQADLVSVYTALVLGRDPTPISSIDRLKQELAEAQ